MNKKLFILLTVAAVANGNVILAMGEAQKKILNEGQNNGWVNYLYNGTVNGLNSTLNTATEYGKSGYHHTTKTIEKYIDPSQSPKERSYMGGLIRYAKKNFDSQFIEKQLGVYGLNNNEAQLSSDYFKKGILDPKMTDEKIKKQITERANNFKYLVGKYKDNLIALHFQLILSNPNNNEQALTNLFKASTNISNIPSENKEFQQFLINNANEWDLRNKTETDFSIEKWRDEKYNTWFKQKTSQFIDNFKNNKTKNNIPVTIENIDTFKDLIKINLKSKNLINFFDHINKSGKKRASLIDQQKQNCYTIDNQTELDLDFMTKHHEYVTKVNEKPIVQIITELNGHKNNLKITVDQVEELIKPASNKPPLKKYFDELREKYSKEKQKPE